MSLKKHTGSQKAFAEIKEKIKHKISNRTLPSALKKPGAKTDSQSRTYAARQEHQDAYREAMNRRWGAFTPSWQKKDNK